MDKTQEAAHTPGPWTIQDDHGSRWIETTTSNDPIAEVHRRNTSVGRHRDIEFDANARLIAAAPEQHAALLEAEAALEIAVDRLKEDKGEEYPVEVTSEHKALQIVRAAIAKATGAQA